MTDPKRPLRCLRLGLGAVSGRGSPARLPASGFRELRSSCSGSLALSDSFPPGCRSPPPLPVCIPLCLPDSVSLAFPSASSACLSVCKSLVPSKLSDPPSQHRAEGPQGRRRSPSSPPAAFPPRRPRQVSPPAPPAHTWSPRPAPPPLLPATRVKAGAGVLNGVSRAPSSGPCAP